VNPIAVSFAVAGLALVGGARVSGRAAALTLGGTVLGVLLLVGLMGLAFYNDIARLLS